MLVFGAVNVSVSINYSVGNSVNHPLQTQKRQNHARSYLLPHRWGQGVCEDHPKSPPHHDTATSAPSSIPKVCCVASASSCCGTWGWKLSGSPWGKVSASSLSSSSCLAENPSTSLLNGVFSSFIWVVFFRWYMIWKFSVHISWHFPHFLDRNFNLQYVQTFQGFAGLVLSILQNAVKTNSKSLRCSDLNNAPRLISPSCTAKGPLLLRSSCSS